MIPEGNKFCMKCGAKAEPEQAAGKNPGPEFQDGPAGAQRQTAPRPGVKICGRCGAEVPDGMKFCTACGAPMEGGAGGQTPQRGNTGNGAGPVKPVKKKSKKGLVIGVVSAVVVIGAGVGVFAAVNSNAFKAKFSSPEDYYREIETAWLKEQAEKAGSGYGKGLENTKGTAIEGTVKLRVEEGGQALLGVTDIGEELSALNDLEIRLNMGSSDGLFGMEAALYSAEERLAGMQTVLDQEAGDAYIQIPELSDTYLYMSAEELYGTGYYSQAQAAEAVKEMMEALPSAETVTSLMEHYGGIFIDHAKDVEKESGVLEVGGVSQDCTLLTVTLDENELQELAVEILESLKSDQDVEDMILAVGNASAAGGEESGTAYYEEFQDTIQETIDQLESATPEACEVRMLVWVDKKGEIAGRKLSMTVDGESQDLIAYQCPRDGDACALKVSIGDEERNGGYDYVVLEGEGTISGDKVNGEWGLSAGGVEALQIDVADYDLKKAEDGYLSGSFTFSTQMMAEFQNYALTLDLEQEEDGGNVSLTVLSNDAALASLEITAARSETYKIALPDSSDICDVSDYDEMEAYEEGADIQGLLEKLSQNPFLELILSESMGYGY